MEQGTLPPEILVELRAKGLISETEIIYREGDLYIAKDVVTNLKRIIEYGGPVREGRGDKRLLKG
jgi:hypothetical protein